MNHPGLVRYLDTTKDNWTNFKKNIKSIEETTEKRKKIMTTFSCLITSLEIGKKLPQSNKMYSRSFEPDEDVNVFDVARAYYNSDVQNLTDILHKFVLGEFVLSGYEKEYSSLLLHLHFSTKYPFHLCRDKVIRCLKDIKLDRTIVIDRDYLFYLIDGEYPSDCYTLDDYYRYEIESNIVDYY